MEALIISVFIGLIGVLIVETLDNKNVNSRIDFIESNLGLPSSKNIDKRKEKKK